MSFILRLFSLLLLAFTIPRFETQAQAVGEGARFSFNKTEHDFGTVKPDTTVAYRFEFVNAGQMMLIINDISLSCPCFEANWVRGPVMPGEKGWVSVRYPTTSKAGPFDKLLWITSNAVNNTANLDRFELRIKGMVQAANMAPATDSACKTGHSSKKSSRRKGHK